MERERVDGDSLRFAVQYSADAGASWGTLATDLEGDSLTVARSALAATAQGLVRVLASDGLLTAADQSDAVFAVANNPPQVAILRSRLPAFSGNQRLVLEATAHDTEDGMLAPGRLAWSSSLDGALGSGTELELLVSALSPGVHQLTVTASDLAGATATASTRLWIDTPAVFADGFETTLQTGSPR